MLLTGKTAVISGGAGKRGIGFATAKLFAEHGARFAILDLDGASPQGAAAALPGEGHIGLICDVTDRAACTAAASAVLKAFGRVDVLINNAGITQPIKFLDITPEHYDAVMDVNLRGTLYLSQAFIPQMRAQGGGSIACTSSVSAQRGGGHPGRPSLFGREGRHAGPGEGNGAGVRAGGHPGQLRDAGPDPDGHQRGQDPGRGAGGYPEGHPARAPGRRGRRGGGVPVPGVPAVPATSPGR